MFRDHDDVTPGIGVGPGMTNRSQVNVSAGQTNLLAFLGLDPVPLALVAAPEHPLEGLPGMRGILYASAASGAVRVPPPADHGAARR